MSYDEQKLYLIYTKNSKKPVHVFWADNEHIAVAQFQLHPQAKYCKISTLTVDTLESVKKGAQIEFERLRLLLKSIDDDLVCL